MNIRRLEEERERRDFCEFACLSENSRGRKRPEEDCDIRTCFMRDRDRIIHSKSFRRLKHKTQVFISPEGDHYRTRLAQVFVKVKSARNCPRNAGNLKRMCKACAVMVTFRGDEYLCFML